MSFEHQGLAFNRLDTPGHEDFSEDTYRALTGIGFRPQWRKGGIEEQTCKLFEVWGLGDVPIITFGSKLDRKGATRSTSWTRSSNRSRSSDLGWLAKSASRDFARAHDLFAAALIVRARHPRPRHRAGLLQGSRTPQLPRLLPKVALV
jgi:hypothetical protein